MADMSPSQMGAIAISGIIIAFIMAGSAWAANPQIDVKDFGAKGDGKTDDTLAFQKALDQAGKMGGIVLVPPGQYRLDGVISVPEGVTLEGVWRGPHTSQLDKGSTLLAYAGRDEENSKPFISLKTDSTLEGVTIFYPEQNVTDIHPYPWTIQGQGQNYNIIDVTIANAFNGVDCGTFHNEGHHLINVLMCALRRGGVDRSMHGYRKIRECSPS
jgi:polygalacturonase